LLFSYKVPNKPSANRVYVWRKLKKLGAVSPQDSLFILPKTYKNLENLQWIAEEIVEMKGESYLFEGNSIGFNKNEELIYKFNENVNSLYKEVLSDIDSNTIKSSDELKLALARYKDIKQKDFFNSCLGNEIFEKLKELELKFKSEGLI
jgi:hypothetical protein